MKKIKVLKQDFSKQIIKKEFDKVRGQGFLIYHQKPMRRIISVNYYDEYDDYEKKSMYFLSFPNIFFRINYIYNPKTKNFSNKDVHVIFVNNELNKIYYPKLLNVWTENSRVCLSKNVVVKNINKLIQGILFNFWNSDFNLDVDEATFSMYLKDFDYNEVCQNEIKGNLTDWQYRTKKDSNYIPSKFVPFDKCDLTLDCFMNDFIL